uniref:Uncharacterized protein n=1 Tax=Trichuris muris TaxID=70415 RepID=A0A5S6QRX8_TRIMR
MEQETATRQWVLRPLDLRPHERGAQVLSRQREQGSRKAAGPVDPCLIALHHEKDRHSFLCAILPSVQMAAAPRCYQFGMHKAAAPFAILYVWEGSGRMVISHASRVHVRNSQRLVTARRSYFEGSRYCTKRDAMKFSNGQQQDLWHYIFNAIDNFTISLIR